MAQKIDRINLQRLFFNAIEGVPNQLLDGLNPFHVIIDEKEFYIYIKNLSPAYFTNPDVWRAQLPKMEIFDVIKSSDVPFILLGYDGENDVYATWNPAWGKQRLNEGESVSFYSRLSVQKEAREKKQLCRIELNHDGEALVFPREFLPEVLDGINHFFLNNGTYVAVGSKRRPEANQAYKEFSDIKNIAKIYNYAIEKGYSSTTANHYCQGVKKIFSEGFVSRLKKVFLSYDSLSDYEKAVPVFFSDPYLKERDQKGKGMYSAALKVYIRMLNELGSNSRVSQQEPLPYEQIEVNTILEEPTTHHYTIGLFDVFCNPRTIYRFPSYLNSIKLSPNTSSHYTRSINYLFDEGFIEKYDYLFKGCLSPEDLKQASKKFFAIPEIHELNIKRHQDYSAAMGKFIDMIKHFSKGNSEPEIDVIKSSNESPNGISRPSVDTNDEVMVPTTDYEEKYIKDGKLTRIADPKVLEELRPLLDTEYRQLSAAYNVIFKYYAEKFPSMQMSDWGKLLNQINWGSGSTVQQSEMVNNTQSDNGLYLKIQYPDGNVLCLSSASRTFMMFIDKCGAERIAELGITHFGVNIVSRVKDSRYGSQQRPISGGWYVLTNISTPRKYRDLQLIKMRLGLDIDIKMMSSDTGKEYLPSGTSSQNEKGSEGRKKSIILRITYPDGKIVQCQKASETLIDFIQYVGPEKVSRLNIKSGGVNIVAAQRDAKYGDYQREISGGWFVLTNPGTDRKYMYICEIIKTYNLPVSVDIVSSDTYEIIDPKSLQRSTATVRKAERQKIRVVFPDGTEIQDNQVARTLLSVVEYAGPERVHDLNINVNRGNLVSKTVNPIYVVATKPVSGGWYVNTQTDTPRKYEIIKEISDKLGLGLIVDLVD